MKSFTINIAKLFFINTDFAVNSEVSFHYVNFLLIQPVTSRYI